MIVISVTPARNEEKFIANSLTALKSQTKPVEYSVVVNDGSTDRTKEIAHGFGVNVVDLPDRGYSVVDKKELAITVNAGIEAAINRYPNYDYLLLIGPDTIMPVDYVEKIIEYMKRDDVDMASGVIIGEEDITNVRGSGRIFSRSFIDEMHQVTGILGYPVISFWESYPIHYCHHYPRKAKVYRELLLEHERPTLTNYKINSMFVRGQIERALQKPVYRFMIKLSYMIIKFKVKSAYHLLRGYMKSPEILYPRRY